MHRHNFTVTKTELNAEYGHVHHAHILLFMEQARLSFLREIGFSAEKLMLSGIYPVIAAINIEYLREIVLGDYVVTCEDCKIEGRSIFIQQRIINEKGRIAVDSKVESMLFDKNVGRAVRPSPEFAKALLASNGPAGGVV